MLAVRAIAGFVRVAALARVTMVVVALVIVAGAIPGFVRIEPMVPVPVQVVVIVGVVVD
jgi:hypothetical protein